MTATTATTVVVDEGSSQIKCTWKADDTIHQLMIKARGEYRALETSTGGIADNVYEIDGRDITVGNLVRDPVITTSDHYQTSDINRALVYEVLRQAGFGGQHINLIVTLPVDTFYNKAKRLQKKEHMLKPVANANGLPLPIIDNVRVAPEAVPVMDAIRLDDNGKELADYENTQRILIVDIGGTTTDITVVNNENSVERRKSVPNGVFAIANTLKELLQNDPEIDAKSPSDDAIDFTLRNGLFRNKTEVSHHITKACQKISGSLLSAMTAIQPDPDDVDFVVYVGGGADLLTGILSSQYGGNTLTFPNPEYAVALGLLRNEIYQLQPA